LIQVLYFFSSTKKIKVKSTRFILKFFQFGALKIKRGRVRSRD